MYVLVCGSSIQAAQAACCIVYKCFGCPVSISVMLSYIVLLELYQEKLVTEDELKRMKTGLNLCQRLVFVQSTKHQRVVIRTVHVLDNFGHNEGAKQLRGWCKYSTGTSV